MGSDPPDLAVNQGVVRTYPNVSTARLEGDLSFNCRGPPVVPGKYHPSWLQPELLLCASECRKKSLDFVSFWDDPSTPPHHLLEMMGL